MKQEGKDGDDKDSTANALLSERSADKIIEDPLFPELRIKLASLGRLAMRDYLIFLSTPAACEP